VKTKLTAALSGAALIVTMGALAGCGDNTNEKLDSWAKTVCDQASAQVKKINAANTAITQVDVGGKPADIQQSDAAAFQQISDAYKALATIVDKAGNPPVEKGGATLRSGSVADLNQLSASYTDLKRQIDDLDTKDQGKFADGLQTVSDNLGKVSKSGEQALDTLRRGEVGQAMAGQAGCADGGSSSPSATASS
jgi:hypothetical protein